MKNCKQSIWHIFSVNQILKKSIILDTDWEAMKQLGITVSVL